MAKFKEGQKVVVWNGNIGEWGTVSCVWDTFEGRRQQLYDVVSHDEGITMVGVWEDDMEERRDE